MDYRPLGRTGLRVSALGFGCGDVGGLIVKGTPAERERAVARAVELGINYFDTAAAYGNGRSEENLGEVLRRLKPDVYVGTKFRLEPADLADVAGGVARSLEASLRRLKLEREDLLQLHNHISLGPGERTVSVSTLLDDVVASLRRLREQGKLRFYGITALGETGALHRALGAQALDTAQVCYNLLNPSAGLAVPSGFPGHDFQSLLGPAREHGVGVIVIRVLAAGALSGQLDRHPLAMPSVAPIASGPDYASDVAHARQLEGIVRDGHAGSLVEAALRFPLGSEAVSTVLLGYSTLEHLEYAAASIARGPLSPAALDALGQAWRRFAHPAST
jgi:aryl-alcohol dehydrogenase-like predicted oxidoreductase